MIRIICTIIFSFSISLGISQTFQDNVASEPMGDFPSQWDVVKGMAITDQVDGYKMIGFMHGGIIKPIVNRQTNNYLGSDFTIEFDAFFDKSSGEGIRLEVRLWDGEFGYSNGNIRYTPFILYKHGIKTSWNSPEPGNAANTIQELRTEDPVWRHITFECKNEKLKVLLDGNLILTFPKFKMQPTMVSIGGLINSNFDAKVGFTNFSIVSPPVETKIVMFVDRQTNQVKDINLYANLQETASLNSKYPNTRAYFGTLFGNYTLSESQLIEFKKKPVEVRGFSMATITETKSVRPIEFSDDKKPQFIDVNTYSKFTLQPVKEAQMVFDFENEFITENLNLNTNQAYVRSFSGNTLKGDYFLSSSTFSTPIKDLSIKDNKLYVLPKGETVLIETQTLIGETEKNDLGQVQNTFNTPSGIAEDTTIKEGIVKDPLLPINTETTPQITPLQLVDKTIKLKVTLTDLLCIKKSGMNDVKYSFLQSIDYKANENNKIAIEKIWGNKGVNFNCGLDGSTGCYGTSISYKNNTLSHHLQPYIRLTQTGKKESNVMNALVFELTPQELNDKNARFIIKSYLREYNAGGVTIFDSEKILYDSYIEVPIYEILSDLILANQNKQLNGFSVPFHDPEIMKAQYGLFKTYDSGPNAKLWVRKVGKTLEGPISLGNTTANNGQRGAAWIKFELID